ncbi:MAG TPA: hypothetical protein VHW71_19345 [Steroidobacteraceae bacterium]|nr:hypothetical protein [Steroidobacteraceae bacterium]
MRAQLSQEPKPRHDPVVEVDQSDSISWAMSIRIVVSFTVAAEQLHIS